MKFDILISVLPESYIFSGNIKCSVEADTFNEIKDQIKNFMDSMPNTDNNPIIYEWTFESLVTPNQKANFIKLN